MLPFIDLAAVLLVCECDCDLFAINNH